MSFGLPSVKVKPEDYCKDIRAKEGPYGVPDPLSAGIGSAHNKMLISHPLEVSERNFHLHEEKMNMAILRNTQGLHAPLKLSMEMKAVSKIGRLPFLPSSNMMYEVLTGRNIDIGFEDILNPSDLCEVPRQPHAVMEKSLGLL